MKSLKEQIELILDDLIDGKTNFENALIPVLNIQIELIEAMMDPEDPG